MLFCVGVLAKPMKYCSLARLALSRSLCISSGSICRSTTECPDLQKCSATPDLSVFLLMMSLRCSLCLSRSRLPVLSDVLAARGGGGVTQPKSVPIIP